MFARICSVCSAVFVALAVASVVVATLAVGPSALANESLSDSCGCSFGNVSPLQTSCPNGLGCPDTEFFECAACSCWEADDGTIFCAVSNSS